VIVYLDTSAFVPLFIDEPASARCRRLWDEADDVVVTRLVYVESMAALAQAGRLGRLTEDELTEAAGRLAGVWRQCSVLELDSTLMERAGELAGIYGLRGYDSVHCAAGEAFAGQDAAAASGDKKLLSAWYELGLPTMDVNGDSLHPG
jgi:predicted nucleic acid-binding protein